VVPLPREIRGRIGWWRSGRAAESESVEDTCKALARRLKAFGERENIVASK
jgi:hypothetical protein